VITIHQRGMFALRRPNKTGLLQGEHPEIFARMGWGGEKVILAYKSSNISETRQDRTKVALLMTTNRKS